MAFFWELIFGPVPSNVFINNLEDTTEFTFSKFVDPTNSGSGEVCDNVSLPTALLRHGAGSCYREGRTAFQGGPQDAGELSCQVLDEIQQMQSPVSEAD